MEAQCEANTGGVRSIPAPGESRMLRSSWTRAPQLLSRSSGAEPGPLQSEPPEPGSRQKPRRLEATGTGEERRRAEETPSQQRKPSTAPNQ